MIYSTGASGGNKCYGEKKDDVMRSEGMGPYRVAIRAGVPAKVSFKVSYK